VRNGVAAGVAVLVVLVTSAPGAAKGGFAGNVCALLTAKQASSTGATAACKNAAPLPGPGSTDYTANWAGTTTTSPSLQVTVASYSDTGLLALARKNLKQGLNGPPVKVTVKGLGVIYEAKGAAASGLHFATGKYVVYIVLGSLKTPPNAPSSLVPLAMAVKAGLA
jgi:hypothetical protein